MLVHCAKRKGERRGKKKKPFHSGFQVLITKKAVERRLNCFWGVFVSRLLKVGRERGFRVILTLFKIPFLLECFRHIWRLLQNPIGFIFNLCRNLLSLSAAFSMEFSKVPVCHFVINVTFTAFALSWTYVVDVILRLAEVSPKISLSEIEGTEDCG